VGGGVRAISSEASFALAVNSNGTWIAGSSLDLAFVPDNPAGIGVRVHGFTHSVGLGNNIITGDATAPSGLFQSIKVFCASSSFSGTFTLKWQKTNV
jgi:hypothetical protein